MCSLFHSTRSRNGNFPANAPFHLARPGQGKLLCGRRVSAICPEPKLAQAMRSKPMQEPALWKW